MEDLKQFISRITITRASRNNNNSSNNNNNNL